MPLIRDAKRVESKRIAIVLAAEYSYARQVLHGIIETSRTPDPSTHSVNSKGRERWHFRIFRGAEGSSAARLRPLLHDWRPDGIIAEVYDADLAQLYKQLRKPIVELFAHHDTSNGVPIIVDDYSVGRMAARHFIDRGFRHFAYFGDKANIWSQERGRGLVAELENAFGANDAKKVYTLSIKSSRLHSQHAARSVKDIAKLSSWISSLPRPLALFTGNDQWGYELCQIINDLGLNVPHDVAVLGVDNEESHCELAEPPLSSIRVAFEQVGRNAIEALSRQLRGEKVKSPEPVLPLGVVVRHSTDVMAVEDPEVAQAMQFIRDHVKTGLNVNDLLDVVPLNRRTLERRFVAALGETPLHAIQRLRLENAVSLLQTDLPIYEVARRSGFGSAEYLAAQFKRARGITPTEFRLKLGSPDRINSRKYERRSH